MRLRSNRAIGPVVLEISDLPLEMIVEIFETLDVNSLLECYLVSKNWQLIIESHIRIKNLNVARERSKLSTRIRYAFENRPIEHCSLITLDEQFLRPNLMKMMCKNLKNLHLDFPENYCDEIIGNLDDCTQLERLRIRFVRSPFNDIELKLPKLKSLLLFPIHHDQYPEDKILTFDTPMLSKIELLGNDLGRVNFKYPKQVTHLHSIFNHASVLEFVNLQYYYCKNFPLFSRNIREARLVSILEALPLLKELHCMGEIDRSTIETAISTKNKKRKLDFHLYLAGVRIDCVNDLTEFLDEHDAPLISTLTDTTTILRNQSRIATFAPWLTRVNYTDLANFNGRIETNLFDRLVNLNFLLVREPIIDLDHFVNFIVRLKSIECLRLNASRLNQSFYNQLKYYLPGLKRLEIYEATRALNCEFILQLNLREFRTSQKLPYSVVQQAFDSELENLVFVKNKKWFKVIHNMCTNRIEVLYDNTCTDFPSKREMLHFLRKFFDLFP